MLIEVLRLEARRVRKIDSAQSHRRRTYLDYARQFCQFAALGALVPDLHPILSIRHFRNLRVAIAITHGKIRRTECKNVGIHVGMNIAEDEGNSWLVEDHFARTPGFVKSQVKPLSLIKREHIVEEWILVGEFHCRTYRDREDVRVKLFVLLHDPGRDSL